MLNIHNFVLSYYKNAVDGIHIQRIHSSAQAGTPHTHTYFQIYYVVKGSIVHYMESSSSILSKGDMFIIPPNNLHYIQPDADADFYSFSFMPEAFGEINSANLLVINFLNTLKVAKKEQIYPKITIPSDEIRHTEDIMAQMLKNFNSKPLGYGEVLRAYGVLLLTLFARIYYEAMPQELDALPENNRQAILYCVQYIDLNFTNDISLSDMVHQCSMSKSSFCELFKQVTGMTFHKYLHNCRINHAISYIKKGYKITGIYGLCGYNDFSTFYRNFKSITGVSPEQYKKMH